MKPDTAPTIHSFIVRFVVEETPSAEATQPAFHGSVRHIQSNEELHFRAWPEAVEFMRRFVPLTALTPKPNPEPKRET